ncbi:MAG: cation transporter [Bdellovibrionaceae bacterium]|jgi:cation diffusion facilitator family transporter|nr:cation transporter [Pseudobdellovibrionaceae bacterium]
MEVKKLQEDTTQDDIHRKYAAQITLVVSIILLFAKFWAHKITGSQAILSDALESIVNVVAAILLLFVIYYTAKPADEDHPYGHGKAEYFSAAFEGGLITFAGFLIVIEGVKSLVFGNQLQELSEGLIIVIAAGVVNFLLGIFLIHQGKKRNSEALKGSGHHVLSDFWTSVGIVAGLIIVKFTGILWLDPVIAILVGLLLLVSGVQLAKKSVGALLDEENLDDLETLRAVLEKTTAKHSIIQVHHVKLIRSGRYHHIDAHLVLPEFWTVNDIHDNVLRFETETIREYSYQGELNTHIDPCRKAYCEVCQVKDCKIREKEFKKKMPVMLEHLRSMEEPKEFS